MTTTAIATATSTPKAAEGKVKRKFARPANSSLPPDQSAPLRDALIAEMEPLKNAEEAADWVYRNLPAKNTLTADDARQVEERFQAKLSTLEAGQGAVEAEVANEEAHPNASNSDAEDHFERGPRDGDGRLEPPMVATEHVKAPNGAEIFPLQPRAPFPADGALSRRRSGCVTRCIASS